MANPTQPDHPVTAQEFLARFPQANEPQENCLVDKACTKCGSRELCVQAIRWVAVFDDGTDDDAPGLPDHDTEYDENSPARCRTCGHDDAWGDFTIEGLDALLAAAEAPEEI